ncbi:phage tail protein, partial [Acinetobacter baumannii]
GSLGFAQEGWYIEVPKDANGNTVVAVEYSTLENGDISIKTYKRKFDFELAAVVADHENPMDIPEGRWIDIRLHEEPEPEPE